MEIIMKKLILLSLVLTLVLAACTPQGDDTSSTVTSDETIDIPSRIFQSDNPSPSSQESGDSSSKNVSSNSSTYSNYTEFTDNSSNAPSIDDILLTPVNSYYTTSSNIIGIKVENRTGWEMLCSDDYTVERKTSDGWNPLELSADETVEHKIYPLDNGDDIVVELDMTLIKQKLEIGTYRINLHLMCNGYAGDFYKSVTVSIK